MKIISLIKIITLNFIIMISLSCNKKSGNDSNMHKDINITVSATINNHTEGKLLSNKTASLNHSAISIKDTVFSLNNKLDIYANLSSVSQSDIISNNDPKFSKKISSTSPLATNIYYKLVVYTSTGAFKAERVYKRGDENNTTISPELRLDGGETYTFVAYSINSTNLNDLNLIAGSFQTQTLANSSISTSDDIDLLFYKGVKTITGDNTDHLEIVFNHVFNKINVIIDATSTGYNVEEVVASISSSKNVNTLNFSSNTLVSSGVEKTKSINFSSTPTTIKNSDSFIFNGTNGGTTLSISKLRIGEVEEGSVSQPLIPFTNLSLIRGEEYNLKLTITTKDYMGSDTITNSPGVITIYPIAVIGGMTWLTHNTGADLSINPLTNPSVEALVGNYYQWGRDAVYATTSTPNGNIANCCALNNPLYTSSTAWAPEKPISTTLCPSGYRVPTRQEYVTLIALTAGTNIGTFSTDINVNAPNNFTVAKILTSKRNANVKLVFPAAGLRSATNGSLERRTYGGYYWSSTYNTGNPSQYFGLTVISNNHILDNSNYDWGFNMRCIKRSPTEI